MIKNLLILLLLSGATTFQLQAQSPKENPGNKGLQYLIDNKDKLGFAEDDCSGSYVSDATYNRINGAWHIYCQQTLNGYKIMNAIASVTFDKEGNVFHVTENWVHNKSNHISKGDLKFTKEQALETALAHLNIETEEISQPELVTLNTKYIENHTYAELIWISDDLEKLSLCWRIIINQASTNQWHNVFVGASENKVINQHNWTNNCEFDIHNDGTSIPNELRIENADKVNAAGRYNVFPFPVESPIHGSQSTVNTFDALASPFGWHDTDGIAGAELTITRGNNVFASIDAIPDNNPEFSPNGSSNLDFNFNFGLNTDPADMKSSAVTQLFYANNALHDYAYRYGFDEISGNFQLNNYGKGGAGSDFVNADAQDGSGTNNANFATPPDGSNGRMQMYLWFSGVTAQPRFIVTNPLTIAKAYTFALANFGPRLSKDVVQADVALVDDGSGKPQKGCTTLINASEINGKFALVERGYCSFMQKALMAQNAGAIGMILYDTSTKTPFNMTVDNTIKTPIVITSVMISKADGAALIAKLAEDVNVKIYDSSLVGVKRYDADFDNGVMAHEFGHGISTRLTCGPANSDGLKNQEQMGEGWSDFFSLAFTVQPGDLGTKARGIGTYVKGQTTTGVGIRTHRYSTDMTVNPHTYNSIKSETIPHGVGSVWCAMLWDLYWMMVDRYGMDNNIASGTGGNNKTIQLVIDGLKLQKCSPGFIDARNAILKADSLNNQGKNVDLIWNAFAKRGLGFSAKQGSSSSRGDGTEAFDLPDFLNSIEPQSSVNDILIYPNPGNGIFNIKADYLTIKSIQVTDVVGKIVLAEQSATNNRIDMTKLPDGVYLIKITTPQGSLVKKVTKK